MAERKKINRDQIGQVALQIVQKFGSENLSMRTLANELGIKAPSLYEHVTNRDEIVALVQSLGLQSFGAGFAKAGPKTRDKILFYRSWALENKNLYPVVFQQKLHRALLPAGLEESVLASVISAAGGSHLRARAVWAQLHGLIDLELQGRFPADADIAATWEQVIVEFEGNEILSQSKENLNGNE